MGGSSAQPQDLIYKKKKKELRKKRRQLITDIEGDLFNLKIIFENWERSPNWYRREAFRYLDLIEKRIEDFEDRDTTLKLESVLLDKIVLLRMGIDTGLIGRELNLIDLLFKSLKKINE